MSETKKSVITNITNKSFNEEYKNWSHGVKMENGDEGFLSCKKEYNGGEEIEYTIETLTSKQGKPYNKLKLASQNGFSGGFNRGGFAKQGSNASFALSYAKDIVLEQIKLGKCDDMKTSEIATATCKVGEIFKTWLDANQ